MEKSIDPAESEIFRKTRKPRKVATTIAIVMAAALLMVQ